MGKQRQLKRERRLKKINAGIMQIILSDKEMTKRLMEITTLKINPLANRELLEEKVSELSRMVKDSVFNK